MPCICRKLSIYFSEYIDIPAYVIYRRSCWKARPCRFAGMETGFATLYLDRSAIRSAGAKQITSIIINEITRSLLQREREKGGGGGRRGVKRSLTAEREHWSGGNERRYRRDLHEPVYFSRRKLPTAANFRECAAKRRFHDNVIIAIRLI